MSEENITTNSNDNEEFELNHSDKLVGIFTEPCKTFSSISKFPLKVKDWIVPLLFFIVVLVISSVLMMSNPIIKNHVVQKQNETIQKMVDDGILTQQQADAQMSGAEMFMEGPLFIVIQAVSISITMFIMFFIVTGFYFLFAKYVLKGEGSFKGVMVSYSLPLYISIIQSIFVVILAFVFDRIVGGINANAFLDISTQEFGGFMLSKIDPFSIWFYSVFAIGLAKLFNSGNVKKFFYMVFGVWIGTNIILFFIASGSPFLQRMIGIM